MDAHDEPLPILNDNANINSMMRLLFLSFFLLAGCSSMQPYTGMSQEDWSASNTNEKFVAVGNITESWFTSIFQRRPSSGKETLLVKMKSGHARMWPSGKTEPIDSVALYLSPETCQTVRLNSTSSQEGTSLRMCLKGDTLRIDPSRWQTDLKQASLNINRTVVWKEGIDYTGLNSKGYTQLSDATIYIETVNSSE
ncbi:MAG: hypothetical protein CMF41_06060 [Legionellales bacterium]|nr:hypothetical protein [Legionellales bacterium]OUX64277.1 MAG: hypothetical protein CBE41_03675 [Gammaproteobacteria bacterium TMED281]|tara:strand:- start:326 stop:913 length:588 start_codon:yes stop_codon:yes gene_type:complete